MDNLEYQASTQTLIGTKKKEFIDIETGEKIKCDQIVKRCYGGRQFWKIYLSDLLAVLGVLESKQADVFCYICENTNPSTNVFMGTYDTIMQECGVSKPTVVEIMKKLQKARFITKKMRSVYIVNPNILMKGNEHKRAILLTYFENPEPMTEIDFHRFELTMKRNQLEVEEVPVIDIDEDGNEYDSNLLKDKN